MKWVKRKGGRERENEVRRIEERQDSDKENILSIHMTYKFLFLGSGPQRGLCPVGQRR